MNEGIMTSYEDRCRQLREDIRRADGSIGLAKDTSNLFRARSDEGKKKIDVRHFNHVLSVNAEEHWVDVEGMTTYEKLVDETLPYGEIPAVVPQLKSITIGGAVSGVGIEASSFRFGLVHETVLEMDVLLPDGTIVTARPDNGHKDLFFGLPNSYGTLGYILRVRARTVSAKQSVHLRYDHFDDPSAFFAAMERTSSSMDADFVDGVVFDRSNMTLITGTFTNDAPYESDYTWMKIFYRSIRNRREDYLTARDFIWRWDTDWFWCSKNLGMHNPLLRLLMGRKRLNSITYNAIMRWSSRHGIGDMMDRFRGGGSESVIQDICIPARNAARFLDFLLSTIGILPIWICPSRSPDPSKRFALFPMHEGLVFDFGFWDFVRTKERFAPGHFNRMIEEETMRLSGIKSLYSSSFFDEETFWKIYNGEAYRLLKRRYDPQGKMKDLYQKCVLRG